jgi:hypothetical protein
MARIRSLSLFSVIGVGASFWVLGTNLSRSKLWEFSLIIAIGMIGLNYLQIYSGLDSRTTFTLIDLITFFIQGFLWPSTWPTLATAMESQVRLQHPQHPEGATGVLPRRKILELCTTPPW